MRSKSQQLMNEISAYVDQYYSERHTAPSVKWGVSVRWVNQYILEGRIPGCERFGRVWAVPEDAVKPKRLSPGVKAKRSSSAQNAAKNQQSNFFNHIVSQN